MERRGGGAAAAELYDPVDVAVIGFGPSGAVLANLLGLAGLRVGVLERMSQMYDLPRAVHFDDEIMRVFQATGLAEQIDNVTIVNQGMQFRDADGKLLLDWPRPQVTTSNGWKASYRFHQPDLEEILSAGLNRFPNVNVLRSAEVCDIEEVDDHVVVSYHCLRPPGMSIDGPLRTMTAKFVVGCDGARSITRRYIAEKSNRDPESDEMGRAEWEDFGFCEKWLVVDVILNRPVPSLGEFTVQTCDPERASTYCRGPGSRRRWEVALLDTETDDEVKQPAWIWKFLERSGLTPDDASIERAAVYRFESKVANSWRRGRVFIAGDAAHLTPPFMGQGMCIGVRDAANLAWKLSLICKGVASETDDSLLDSYESERRPHTKAYVEKAIQLGDLINSGQTAEELQDSMLPKTSPQEQNEPPTADADADSAAGGPATETISAAAANERRPSKMSSIKPQIGPGLGPSRDNGTGYMCGQPLMADGSWLDNLIGYSPVVIADAAFAEVHLNVPRIQSQLEKSGIALVTNKTAPNITGILNTIDQGITAALIRPDRYVLACCHGEDGKEALLGLLGVFQKDPIRSGYK